MTEPRKRERFGKEDLNLHNDTNDCLKKMADLGISENVEGAACKCDDRRKDKATCYPTEEQEHTPSALEATLKIEAFMEKLDVFDLWTERIFSALDRLLQDIETIEDAVRSDTLEDTSRMYSGLLLAKMYSAVGLLLEQVMGMTRPSDNMQIEQSPFCSVFKQDTNGRLMVTLHEAFIHAALAYLKASDRENTGTKEEYMGILNFITTFEASAPTPASAQPGDSLGAPFLSKHSTFFRMIRENALFFSRFQVTSNYRLALSAAYHVSPRAVMQELADRIHHALRDAVAMEKYTCSDHKRLVHILENKSYEADNGLLRTGARARSKERGGSSRDNSKERPKSGDTDTTTSKKPPPKPSDGRQGLTALYNRYRNTDDAYLVFVYNLLQTLDATADRMWAEQKGCACGQRYHVVCESVLYE